jgi:tetratricopeptide (TPR) repeat protein
MMKRIPAPVIFLVVIAAAALAARGGLKRAEELFRRCEYDRARAAAGGDTVSTDRDARAEALLMLARLETDYVSAGRLYRRVMASENARAADRARLDLATMRYAAGDYAGALDLLSEKGAGDSDRDAEKGIYFAALCRRQLGDTVRAAAELASITRGEYSGWSMIARAEIDARQGRLGEAIAKYESVLRSRRDPVAAFGLAECLERAGEREKALDRYRDLIEEFPRSFEAGRSSEKVQLLAAPRGKPKDDKQEGGGEAGKASSRDAASSGDENGSFTIQFGAFGTKANALAAAAKLEGLFRGVRVERFETEGRVMHRVRVGMYESKEAAARDAERAKDRLGMTGAIVPLR